MTVSATPGPWSYAGTSAGLTQLLPASPGTWSWAGVNAGLGQVVNAGPGLWSFGGVSAGLPTFLMPAPGAWSWGGVAAAVFSLSFAGWKSMTAKEEFPVKSFTETLRLTFDYSSFLAAGETISSALPSCAVWSGTDPTPAAVLSGSPSIAGPLVYQFVTAGVQGVLYAVQMLATTSLGQQLNIGGFLAVE